MKKAIQKLQKVYPKLTVMGIFHCPFLLFNLFTLRQGVFFYVSLRCGIVCLQKKFCKKAESYLWDWLGIIIVSERVNLLR